MSNQQIALRLALEALEECRRDPRLKYEHPTYDKAITAIKEALAQPAQQCRTDGRCQYAIDSGAEGMGHCPKCKCVMPAQQEPVAWSSYEYDGVHHKPVAWMSPSWIDPDTRGWQSDSFGSIPIEGWLPLYTAPPQEQRSCDMRTWVGLSDEEAQWLYDNCRTPTNLIDMTEAKLKEKNTK